MSTSLICASHSPLLYCFKKEPLEWEGLQRCSKEKAEAIRGFDPELVIAFGSDHFNGFFMKTMPAFCVGVEAEAVGDIGSMELLTWLSGATAHKSAGGNAPELSFYTVAPEIGIAAGIVHAS